MSIVDFVEEGQSKHKDASKSVCIMGGSKVGKTYLAQILSDSCIPSDYSETTSIQQYSRTTEDKNIQYVFYDHPALEAPTIEGIKVCQCFDIAILLFKDNRSLQDLLNFLETIRQISSSHTNSDDTKYIWKEIRYIFLVYHECDSSLEANIDQLFSIIKEKILAFNQSAIIETYSWSKNDMQLKDFKTKLFKIGQQSCQKIVTHQETERVGSDIKNMPMRDREFLNQQRTSVNSIGRPKLVQKSTGQSDKKLNPFLKQQQIRQNIEFQQRKSVVKGERISDLFEQWRPSSKENKKIDEELFEYLSAKKKQLEQEQQVSEDDLPPENIDLTKKTRTGAGESSDKRDSKSRKTELKKVSTNMQRQSKRRQKKGTDSQICFCSIM